MSVAITRAGNSRNIPDIMVVNYLLYLKLSSNNENIYGHLLFSTFTYNFIKERCVRHRMLVRFTTVYAIIVYHH